MKMEIHGFGQLLSLENLTPQINQAKKITNVNYPDWSFKILKIFIKEPTRLIHSVVVAYCSQAIAQTINNIGKTKIDVDLLFHTGMLHDVGQFGNTLGKTPWHELKGAFILEKIGLDRIAKIMVRHATPIEGLKYEKQPVPRWVSYPQSLEEKILALADFLVSSQGKVVTLKKRFQDVYDRFPLDGLNPAGRITKRAEKRFMQMFTEINGLTGGKLRKILNKTYNDHIREIESLIHYYQ